MVKQAKKRTQEEHTDYWGWKEGDLTPVRGEEAEKLKRWALAQQAIINTRLKAREGKKQ